MGKVLHFRSPVREKRHVKHAAFVRGQQVLADAIFHWKNDPEDDARAAVQFLVHHLAEHFRADDVPLQPRPMAATGKRPLKG